MNRSGYAPSGKIAGMTPEALGTTIVVHLEQWLAEYQLADAQFEQSRARAIAEGLRIVSGGQADPYGDDGKTTFEVKDYATGEVLYSDRIADLEDVPWADDWIDIDRVYDDVPIPDCAVDSSLPQPVRALLQLVADDGQMTAESIEALLAELRG